jgi:hypothetical protein
VAGCRLNETANGFFWSDLPLSFPSRPRRLRTCGQILAASVAILLPCFWQSRMQAGDLSSHLYNAWLAQLIGEGRAPGLTLAHPNTNILFDWMLFLLFRAFGAGPAQRIAVAIAVLIFVWGGFALVSAISGARPWRSLPLIAVLAYGWVFHMGFFNFYISLGLCFGALALFWRGSLRQSLLGVPLLAIAFVAHALPVLWALVLLAYLFTARWLPLRLLLISTFVGMVLLSAVIRARMRTAWFPTQVLSATGLDAVWVFDAKYLLVMAGLLLLWGVPIAASIRESGPRKFLRSIPFHCCALTSFAALVFPNSVLIPGYKHSLAYIGDRMALPLAVCLLGLAARGPKRAIQQYLTAAVVVVFFAFLYHDERALNRLEDSLEKLVATLPPGQRVISGIDAPDLRVNAVTHIIDRVCVGHCYSYANYEPSTAQFRVRAVGESPLVTATFKNSWAMQTGSYTVKPQDLPLYLITLDTAGKPQLISVAAGETPKLREMRLW